MNGKVISMTSNEAGNLPPRKRSARPCDLCARNRRHKSRHLALQILGEIRDYVSPMVTIAPVGGMSAARMGCSMHHGRPAAGALNVGGASTLVSYPAENISYKQHIQPILLNRCKASPRAFRCQPERDISSGDWHYSASTVKYNGSLIWQPIRPAPTTVISDKMISNMVNTTTRIRASY